MRELSPPSRRIPFRPLAVAQLIGCALASPAPLLAETSQPSSTAPLAQAIDSHVAEAAQRFDLPAAWIRAVIEAESAGDPRAISSAGAMGLMQLMPATWAELRARHGLGDDPFDPRDNVLAGTSYLRALYDRFGSPGFLAAYNAGPSRYAEHLTTGRPLPRETRDYVAALAPQIAVEQAPARRATRASRNAAVADWRAAPLFTADEDASPAGPLFVPPLAGRRP